MRTLLHGLVLALIALPLVRCDKVPLLAPTESTIALSAAAASLPLGGSTEVLAQVIEGAGTPVHDGTLVTFTATLGRVEPAQAETVNGVARTTFIAGSTSGTAIIRASSGGATPVEGGDNVEILIGAAAASAVAINATPSRVPASGGTVAIVASAMDPSGNRLTGVPISFTTSAGTLSATAATTDGNGEARVDLTTNREATVTARAGSESATITVSVGTAPSVSLSASSDPRAGTPFVLTVTPAAGTTPRVTVNWGDGTSSDLGIVASQRTATHTYQRSGAYTISAAASQDGDTNTSSIGVTVASGATVTLSDPTPPAPVVGQPVSFTVTPGTGTTPSVVMEWGDGTSTSLGTITGSRTVSHAYASAGSYIVTAEATAGQDTFTTTKVVNVASRPAVNINISATDSNPNRCETVTFTATAAGSENPSISSYQWQVDSNVDSEDETLTTTGNTLTRAFRESGTKTVSVTATTTDGRTGNGQTQIVVQTTPPTCP